MRKESFQGILLGIVIMCAVFAFITVAWAALSSTLTVSGTASVNAQSWKVGFGSTNSAVVSSAVEATCTASAAGATCPTTPNLPVITADKFGQSGEPLTVQSLGTFTDVNGSLTYEWFIVNTGTFDAYLNDLSNTVNTETGKIAVVCDDGADNSYTDGDSTSYANFCTGIDATLKIGTTAAPTTVVAPTLGTKIGKSGGSDSSYLKVELKVTYTGNFTNQGIPNHAVRVSIPSGGISAEFAQTTSAAIGG